MELFKRISLWKGVSLIFCMVAFALPNMALVKAQDKQGLVTIMHYFSGELGRAGLNKIFKKFQESHDITVFDNPIGHEDFKTTILVMSAGNRLPDVFSYWAGARTQFVADAGRLEDISSLWNSNNLDQIVPQGVADGATTYNGKRNLVPFGYHYAGFFYNPKVFQKAGITETPKTWDDLLDLCKKLKDQGITPIALGSKNRWPAQFWFDYLLIRTAGPEFRQDLMSGKVAYTDKKVENAMEIWKQLVDKGYFVKFANAQTWTDASDKVANGEAAMTLMGTWITGYWNGNGLKAETDYDLFPFPPIKSGLAKTVVGPVDGLLISKGSRNLAEAKALVSFMLKDVESQAIWAEAQGALSPNTKVSTSIYSPVMKKALGFVNESEAFAFNYDLATTPPMAEVGLSMFSEFMNDPSGYKRYLEKTENQAKEIFKK